MEHCEAHGDIPAPGVPENVCGVGDGARQCDRLLHGLEQGLFGKGFAVTCTVPRVLHDDHGIPRLREFLHGWRPCLPWGAGRGEEDQRKALRVARRFLSVETAASFDLRVLEVAVGAHPLGGGPAGEEDEGVGTVRAENETAGPAVVAAPDHRELPAAPGAVWGGL
eukprot:368210_1